MQTIGQDPEERSGGGEDLEGEAESESAADLNDYLNEMNELSGENGGSESDSEDAVDVSEYMKESKDPDPTART